MRKKPLFVLLSCQLLILVTVLAANSSAKRIEPVYTPSKEHCPLDPFDTDENWKNDGQPEHR